MRPLLVGLGVVLAVISTFGVVTPAVAQSYPYCHGGDASYSLRCEYATLEQCQATAFGGQGYCTKNPAYALDTHAGNQPAGRPVRSRYPGHGA